MTESWAERGACVGYRLEHGTERWNQVWFPERGTSNYSRARKVCAVCVVRERCRDYAVVNVITHGMWGGTTEWERRKIRAGLDTKPARRQGRRTLKQCGTYAAYRRHLAHGEEPCDECRRARARQKRGEQR